MIKNLILLFAVLFAAPFSWAATTTSNLGMTKPTPIPGSWAAAINKNFDILDAKFPGGFAESTYTIHGSLNYCPDVGTDDAYVCPTSIPWLAYITGSWIEFRPNTVNTLGATVNVNGLGVRAIVQHDGSVLTDGLLAAGRTYRLVYDGTSFRMPSGGAGGIGAETDPNVAKINGLIKSNGATISAAVANTDYAAAAHAARHQQGGADEIATATAAANAIPKAGAGGILAQPWIGASMYDGSQHGCVDAGSTDTYVCSMANAPTAYSARMWIELYANTTNTGASTVNVNALGAKSILKHDGTALADGDLVATRSYRLVYDGTNFRLPSGGGAGTVTGTGTANKLTKFTAGGVIGDSLCSDDGTSINCGDVSGNHYEETFDTATGTHVQNHPAVSGDYAFTTGALVTGNYPKFDSSGRLVDSGVTSADLSVRISHNANQSIADATETTLAFNTEIFDTNTFHDNAVNNSRLTFATAGKYQIGVNADFAANGTGVRYICVKLNGTTGLDCDIRNAVAGGVYTTRVYFTTLYNFAASDYIEAYVFQNSTGALNVTTAALFWAVKQ